MFPAESFSSMKFFTGADIKQTFYLQSLSIYICISIFVVTVNRVASVSSVRLRKISQSWTRDYINRETESEGGRVCQRCKGQCEDVSFDDLTNVSSAGDK